MLSSTIAVARAKFLYGKNNITYKKEMSFIP